MLPFHSPILRKTKTPFPVFCSFVPVRKPYKTSNMHSDACDSIEKKILQKPSVLQHLDDVHAAELHVLVAKAALIVSDIRLSQRSVG